MMEHPGNQGGMLVWAKRGGTPEHVESGEPTEGAPRNPCKGGNLGELGTCIERSDSIMPREEACDDQPLPSSSSFSKEVVTDVEEVTMGKATGGEEAAKEKATGGGAVAGKSKNEEEWSIVSGGKAGKSPKRGEDQKAKLVEKDGNSPNPFIQLELVEKMVDQEKEEEGDIIFGQSTRGSGVHG